MHAFILVKPDAVANNHVGSILSMFEARGFRPVRIQLLALNPYQVKMLYREHLDKPHFQRNFEFMLSGQVCAVLLERKLGQEVGDTTQLVKDICGKTNPSDAGKMTVRGRYGSELPRNAIHSSDNENLALMEASLIFGERLRLTPEDQRPEC